MVTRGSPPDWAGGLASGLIDVSAFSSKVFTGHHSVKHILRSTAYQVGGNTLSGNNIFDNLNFGIDPSLVFPAFQDVLSTSSPLWSSKITKRYIEQQKDYYLNEYGIKGGENISTIVERSKIDVHTHNSGIISAYFDLSFKMESQMKINLPFLKSTTVPFNPSFSTKGSRFPLFGRFNYHLLSSFYLSIFN